MLWDWSSKRKNKPLPEEKNVREEKLDEGKTPVYPPDFGYRKNPRDVKSEAIKPQSSFAKSEEREEIQSETQNISKKYENSYADNAEAFSYDDKPNVWKAQDILEESDMQNIMFAKRENPETSYAETKNGFSVSGQKFSKASVVNVDDDLGIWEWQFSLFNLPSMSLVEVSYNPLDMSARMEMRRMFKKIRRDFLRYIAYYNQAELEEAGVEDKGIRSLKKGKSPENFDVHLKVPYDYGGKNEFSNMIFIQTHPFHEDIHKFIDMQTTSQPFGCRLSKLYIPVAEGRVYVPKETSAIGGGKGKGDKTSVQGYSAAALQQIAVKSTMDRGAGI